MQTTGKAEAERLLAIADKLLQGKDLTGARDFAQLAQETEPLLEGSDQILAVVDVLVAGDKRIKNQNDWYAILQLESQRNDDADLIKRQYRRLALLLHPDKNKYAFADAAFKLVADAWAVLSDPSRKTAYDNELFAFSKVDLVAMKKERDKGDGNRSISRDKIPVRRADGGASANIWTACPYCYNLYEYPRVYEGCCLRCANCQRAFQVVLIPPASLPPTVPGKEAYYCCWGNFPMGFAMANSEITKSATMPNWMPPMFPTNGTAWPSASSLPNGSSVPLAGTGGDSLGETPPQVQQQQSVQMKPAPPTDGSIVPKKRGRPRKNPLA
ncbi:uncharacterized protein LOC112514823 [Cynara cardunculus var. scolymus]|uniref:DnaJ domain-containing protein n=1 Tax=Cynara cardunculus var. scolymus TaxID=59895 RepID=A0A103XZD2_CYNCS|nr:uncharacterized protein LOC112514823 [Cynara cardunculus var. scolymus]KVH99692.1 DnaJ domain-containing protein [Cynara cardunculus var. scolymus]